MPFFVWYSTKISRQCIRPSKASSRSLFHGSHGGTEPRRKTFDSIPDKRYLASQLDGQIFAYLAICIPRRLETHWFSTKLPQVFPPSPYLRDSVRSSVRKRMPAVNELLHKNDDFKNRTVGHFAAPTC